MSRNTVTITDTTLSVEPHGLDKMWSYTWTARCFSDSACFVLQAAFFRSRKSLSTSFGVRYPRAE